MKQDFEAILSAFESLYPGDKRPRKAFEATVEPYESGKHTTRDLTMYYNDLTNRVATSACCAFAESIGVRNYFAANPKDPNAHDMIAASSAERKRFWKHLMAQL